MGLISELEGRHVCLTRNPLNSVQLRLTDVQGSTTAVWAEAPFCVKIYLLSKVSVSQGRTFFRKMFKQIRMLNFKPSMNTKRTSSEPSQMLLFPCTAWNGWSLCFHFWMKLPTWGTWSRVFFSLRMRILCMAKPPVFLHILLHLGKLQASGIPS